MKKNRKSSETMKRLIKEGKCKSKFFRKGHIPWNKDKKMPELSKRYKGKGNPMFGKKAWNNGKKLDRKKYPMMGHFKEHSERTKIKISESKKGQLTGKENPSWQGGKSFKPYGIEFNEDLREKVRQRDSHKCQECGYTQKQLDRKLSIHHIDYNKKNNKLNNLISLCLGCHMQTNFKRENWINYFKQKLWLEVLNKAN